MTGVQHFPQPTKCRRLPAWHAFEAEATAFCPQATVGHLLEAV